MNSAAEAGAGAGGRKGQAGFGLLGGTKHADKFKGADSKGRDIYIYINSSQTKRTYANEE